MSRATTARPGQSFWAAFLLILAFVALQTATLDYGTRINDLPHIRDYRITGDVVVGSSLDRPGLTGDYGARTETLDMWMVRFKLYSIDADEVNNVMALARIRPGALQFDPRFYLYGGAYLYPLGAWYFMLSKIGMIEIGSLGDMLADPDRIDRVWIAGRAFVLAAVTLSALVLYIALAAVAPAPVALAGLAIYLFCPATIMFSQVMKPHWYALLFVNLALLMLAHAFTRGRMTTAGEICLAVVLGLAVGSATTFALFSVLVWLALALLVKDGALRVVSLVRIPLLAIAVFVLSNPYALLNIEVARIERASAQSWFDPSFTFAAVWEFVRNSLLAGYGVALVAALAGVMLVHLLRAQSRGMILFVLALAVPAVAMAVTTANLSHWHVNFRYIPYVLPAAILFLVAAPWPRQGFILALIAIATAAQAAPLKLAYFDENSPTHSTRLVSAQWIEANIPASEAICLSTLTLVPFDVPPLRFDRKVVNTPDCRWRAEVERGTDHVRSFPGYQIVRQFRPRFSPQDFPLVWEHINPQITIYWKP